jgi:RHS repeat-associated protein
MKNQRLVKRRAETSLKTIATSAVRSLHRFCRPTFAKLLLFGLVGSCLSAQGWTFYVLNNGSINMAPTIWTRYSDFVWTSSAPLAPAQTIGPIDMGSTRVGESIYIMDNNENIPCATPGGCTFTPSVGSSYIFYFGSGPSSGGSGPPSLNDDNDLGSSKSCGSCCGMPRWDVSEPFISLWLRDEPLGYQPAVGSRISFFMSYKQRESAAGLNPNIFGIGRRWNCSWLSYVSPDQNGSNVVFFPDGGRAYFYGTNDYQTNTRLVGDTSNGFTLYYPDGRQNLYRFIVTNSSGAFQKAFLSSELNAQSQETIFNYDGYTPGAQPVIRLQSVVDGDGRTNTISYAFASAYSTNLISQVTDPFGRTTVLAYDSDGNLTNVTDTATNSSAFAYDTHGWVTNLTTPYGATSFSITDTNTVAGYYPNGRSIQITRPDGSQELYLYLDNIPGLSSSYGAAQFPSTSPFFDNTLNNAWLDHFDSFHWGPRQFANLSTTNLSALTTNDLLKARMKNWLPVPEVTASTTLSMERDPSPDAAGTLTGQTTWYDYAAKPYSDTQAQGTQSLPLLVARVLSDGTTSFARTDRDSWGNVVQETSTYAASAGVALRTNQYIYSTNGVDLLTVTNALGVMVSSNSYNGYHEVLSHLDALGQATTFTYNSKQQLTSVTFPTGQVITNLFGSDNSLTQQIVVGFATNSVTHSNDLVATHTDARGLTTGNTWDALNRLTSVQFPDGTYNSNVYSKLDLTATRDRLGNWTYFGYDSLRRNTAVTNALLYHTLMSYCVCGALESVQDASGNTTSFYYDNQGNLTNTVYADGYSVQRTMNLLRQVITATDSSGNSVTNTLNNQGLVTSVKNAVGTVGAYAYDLLDRVTNSTDVNGVSISTSFDNLGRPLAHAYPDGGHDACGYTPNVTGYTSYTNQIGNVVLCGYDPLGRKTSEVFVGVRTNQFTLDGPGALLSITDGRNQTTSWNYDEFGRATNKVDAAGVVDFVYQYDASGRLTNGWTPANGNAGYVYDPVGNRTNINYAGGNSISFTYDPLNRLTNMVDALGATRFSYDSAGQLLSSGGLWSGDAVNYSYNNRLRTGLALSGWTNSYVYDAAGRLTNLTSGAGAFRYAYDPSRLMQVARISLPNAAYITNAYDPVARLAGTYLKGSGNNTLDGYTYAYDPLGQRTNIFRDFGIANSTVSAGYDPIGQLNLWVAREANGTGRMNEELQYAYDPAGNLLERLNYGLIQDFKVDPANALTNITRTGQLTVTGNTPAPASSVTVNGLPAQTYADFTFASLYGYTLADGQNSFTNIATNYYGTASVTNIVTANLPASVTLQYDANGNLTNDGSRSFSYDAENQLTNVNLAGQWRSDFFYDALGRRRIERDYTWQSGAWVPTNEVRFLYDGMVVIQELDSNNVAQVTYTRGLDFSRSIQGAGGIGGLLARTDASGSAFYHVDGSGNVTGLIDSTGYIAARYLYDPFGRLLSKWGALADANAMQFSSMPRHANSGLSLYALRAYDPGLQRWMNRDPFAEAGGLNLYRFVHNEPSNRHDPEGGADHTPWDYENRVPNQITLVAGRGLTASTGYPLQPNVWALKALGVAGEATAAAALTLVPEPTLSSKAGAVLLWADTADNAQALFSGKTYFQSALEWYYPDVSPETLQQSMLLKDLGLIPLTLYPLLVECPDSLVRGLDYAKKAMETGQRLAYVYNSETGELGFAAHHGAAADLIGAGSGSESVVYGEYLLGQPMNYTGSMTAQDAATRAVISTLEPH